MVKRAPSGLEPLIRWLHDVTAGLTSEILTFLEKVPVHPLPNMMMHTNAKFAHLDFIIKKRK